MAVTLDGINSPLCSGFGKADRAAFIQRRIPTTTHHATQAGSCSVHGTELAADFALRAADDSRALILDLGEADYGATSAAYSAVAELENQIKSLKWVIEG